MDWVQKYQILTRDRHSILWTSKIYEDGFSGNLISLTGAGLEPLKFEFVNESDDVFDPIKSSRIIHTVWSYSMFALANLYSVDKMFHKVEIYQGADLYWQGYVDPGQYRERYGPVPYPVNVYCVDGLTLLQNILYEESEGVPYNGHKLESQIILDILGKIGFTTFKEFVNLYDVSMSSGVDDSPMDQLKINTDVFADMYCDEVLKEILKKYDANIRQVAGIFCIYRPVELIQTTVYGRIFTAVSAKTSTSITPKQNLSRPGYSQVLLQISDSVVGIQAPAKKVTIIHDYGNKDSWIDNYQFKSDTYDPVTYKFDYWSSGGAVLVSNISALITGELDGCVIISQDTYPAHIRWIYQTFGFNAVITSEDIGFEFEYLFYNTGTALVPTVAFYLELTDSAGTRWLKAGVSGGGLHTIFITDVTWEISQEYIICVEDSPPGLSDWITVKLKIPGLTVKGPYQIRIFSLNVYSPAVYVAIRNIKFYSYSTALSQIASRQVVPYIKKHGIFLNIFRRKNWEREVYYFPVEAKTVIKREYTKTNAIAGDELEYDCILGDVTDSEIDNVIDQFAGALASSIRETLAQAATNFVTEHQYEYPGIEVTCDGEDIIFTEADGNDFTGSSSIVNTKGDLAGSVVNTQAHTLSQAQIDTITITPSSGGSGTADIYCNSCIHEIEWTISRALSISNFVDAYAADYLAYSVDLTSTASTIIFTAHVPGVPFSNATYIQNTSGNISGDVVNTQENITGIPRIDTITLTGSEGTANITVDAITKEVEIEEVLTPTEEWHSRGNAEDKPLLQLICDEIAKQYERPKQFLDLAIMETAVAATALKLLGHFQDSINIFAEHLRAFVANRGSFDVKYRKWKLDLIEIGEGDLGEGEEGPLTVDTTQETTDSTLITVDQTVH